MANEWEELDELCDAPVDADILKLSNEQLAAEYQFLRERQKDVTTRMTQIRTVLSSQANEEPGTYVLNCGAFDAVVTRQEKYEWDQLKLVAMFGSAPSVPAGLEKIVSSSWSVDKARYTKLTDGGLKGPLSTALTRKPGSTSIKIVNKGEATDEDQAT